MEIVNIKVAELKPYDKNAKKHDKTQIDKIADRIAGAIVDIAYEKEENPKVAVEVLIGHNQCTIITESSVDFSYEEICKIVERIAGNVIVHLNQNKQDTHLAGNQQGAIRCGDNGIFKGVPLTDEEKELSQIARHIYHHCESDGKYILADGKLIICQSNILTEAVEPYYRDWFKKYNVVTNPLGDWTGGTNVDTGATNRKLGSDMGHAVTGGGLHGKDLSKADVSVNIYAFLKAQKENRPIELCCAISDTEIDGKPYSEIVEIAREYIKQIGGFEKFAEWGLF